MDLDEELAHLEDGAETQAEQVDEETEALDVEEFQDVEEFDPRAEETDLEDAYEGFFAEEGPDGEGEVSPGGDDGGLAAVVERETGMDLSEEGFHLVDGDGAALDAELGEEGRIDGYDGDELSNDVSDVSLVEPSDIDDGYELVELELDENDIVRYLEDDEGERIGFVLLEDGEECEYYYVDDEEDDSTDSNASDDDDDEFDLGITKEGVAEATQDMNAIYKDGIAVAAELKDAIDDIKAAFDFSAFKK